MRNRPDTSATTRLPLQSDVLVWREREGWQGPHKLLAIDGETCTLGMPYGPTKFRSVVVKPYYRGEHSTEEQQIDTDNGKPNGELAIGPNQRRRRPLGPRKLRPAAIR